MKTCPFNIQRFLKLQKFKIFSRKKNCYFSYFCSKYRLCVHVKPPRQGGSNEYPQSMFWSKIRKNGIPHSMGCRFTIYFILHSETQCISKLDKIGIFIDIKFH